MKDYWNKLAYETQALEQCHDEKILNIGAIQSCSGLIVIDSEFNIVALSENIQECLDVEIDQFLGAPYKSFTLFSNHISCEALKNIEKKKTINVYLDEIKNYDVTINIDNGHFFLDYSGKAITNDEWDNFLLEDGKLKAIKNDFVPLDEFGLETYDDQGNLIYLPGKVEYFDLP